MKANYLIAILFLISNSLFSQTDLDGLVDSYFTLSVDKNPTAGQLNKILASDPLSVTNTLFRYFTDSLPEIRTEAYSLLNIIGNRCKQKEVRIKIVKQIIAGISDKDAGISGININNLTLYKKDDFDNEAIYALSKLLTEKIPNYYLLVKLIGFLGNDEQQEALRKILTDKSYPNNKARLAIHLALARMGDKTETNFLLNKVKSAPVNNDLVYDVFPDLIYTCRKDAYDYMLEVIMSNDKNCTSGNPDATGKIICGYRVIQQISSRIKDFPVETDEYGDIKTKDYNTILTKTREWIKNNKENYIILNDRF